MQAEIDISDIICYSYSTMSHVEISRLQQDDIQLVEMNPAANRSSGEQSPTLRIDDDDALPTSEEYLPTTPYGSQVALINYDQEGISFPDPVHLVQADYPPQGIHSIREGEPLPETSTNTSNFPPITSLSAWVVNPIR